MGSADKEQLQNNFVRVCESSYVNTDRGSWLILSRLFSTKGLSERSRMVRDSRTCCDGLHETARVSSPVLLKSNSFRLYAE